MEIIVGKTAGFCYGVNRAVEGSKKIFKESKEGNIYCLGEIVHNKTVVDELKKEGIKFINKIEEAKGTTIIRAHGVPKEIYKEAENKKIELKDYTCPNVLKIHEIAKKYAEEGYFILLCGNKEHPENIGTISYCGKNFYVINNEKEVYKAIDKIEKSKIKKQFKYANNLEIPYVIVLGEDEINNGTVSLKNMQTGEQTEIKIDELCENSSKYLID